MSLLGMLAGAMTSSASVNSLSEKTGGSSDQISQVVSAALPILLQAMQSNAASDEGASSLAGALAQHKNTASIADQISGADAIDGGKILGHLLGGDTAAVVSQLAGQSGLDANQVAGVLGNIAPALLSSVSAAASSTATKKKGGVDLSDGIDLGDIAGMFGAAGGDAGDAAALLGKLAGLM